jgi:hypothetical protein
MSGLVCVLVKEIARDGREIGNDVGTRYRLIVWTEQSWAPRHKLPRLQTSCAVQEHVPKFGDPIEPAGWASPVNETLKVPRQFVPRIDLVLLLAGEIGSGGR